MLTLTSCPDCHAPAEITDRFTLASTDGPVAHVAVSCLAGHHYRMPADKLPGPDSPPPRRSRTPPFPHPRAGPPPLPAPFMIMGHSEQIPPKKTHDHEAAGWCGVQSHPARGRPGH